MKLTDFYDADAATNWFSKKYEKLSVHEALEQRKFHIIEKQFLQQQCEDIEIPVSIANMSWGGRIPRPKNDTVNTYIAKELYDLKEDKYKSVILANMLSTWMREKLTGTKYLISLNPKHYLVATANDIEFEDVFMVTKAWSLDCWIGVFDETGAISFIFDAEFWTTIISCSQIEMSDEMRSFSDYHNDEFNEIFIRDNHLLSHADPTRAQEYFNKIYSRKV